jgi:hypothetical protein
MNRREFLGGCGGFAISMRSTDLAALAASPEQSARFSSESLPSVVAGVRLVDSTIARAATELSRSASPPFLFNHAVRTFLFGSLIGQALGERFDEELLYLACILHDLGLTERFEGELPFEIQGAQAAKRFLDERSYPMERVGIVWDGVAMHTSLIGHYKQPEIRLVGEGAGADVAGPDASQITKTALNEVLRAFPRLQFKTSFVKTCAEVVLKYPSGATRSFMRDIGERYVRDFHPRNICDLITQAPFPE